MTTGEPAVDASLVHHGDEVGFDAGLYRQLCSWMGGADGRWVRLVVTGGEGPGLEALRRFVADGGGCPADRSRRLADTPGTVVRPVGGVALALDATERSTGEVAGRLARRFGPTGRPPPDAAGKGVRPGATIVIAAVDGAADPGQLIDELLAPLAKEGVRLLLAFGQHSSPAWELAQTHWPDHDLPDDDPLVLGQRLHALNGLIAELSAREDALLRRRDSVALRIAGVPELATRAMSLRRRLSALTDPPGPLDDPETVEGLGACESAAARVAERLDTLDAMLSALLTWRGRLHRRLEASHASAVAEGRCPAPVADRLYHQALDVLGRSPCDLRLAADLVARYRRALAGAGNP